MASAIGGFFGLALPQPSLEHHCLRLWQSQPQNSLYLHNARSCLHYLLSAQQAKRIWLPAYCCASLVEGADIGTASLNFYPLNPQLSPNVDFLKRHLLADDYVLAIDYFGRKPLPDFLALVTSRADIHWIEDRAQALFPDANPWGDWIIYSPRKLCGVPDGGILVSRLGVPCPIVETVAPTSLDFMQAALLRFENVGQAESQQAYAAFIAAENKMAVSTQAMSQLTYSLLQTQDPSPWVATRQANYAYLHAALGQYQFFQENNLDFVPLGFVIQIPERDKIWETLCQQHIFAQRHWVDLPVSAQEFPEEHALSKQLLTLPCDQRYSTLEMERIVTTLRGIL